MENPGLTGALNDPDMLASADDKAQQLLDKLKQEVQADIQDIGTLRKEVTVTVPEGVIAEHVAHNYDELMTDAVVPGFRKGRAPRKLVEKRFGQDVRQSLKTTIIGQSYYAAIENNELEVLGDPLFKVTDSEGGGIKLVDIGEALGALELPESSDFSYTCEVELKPAFELPELKGIEVKTPAFEITDEMVTEQLERHRKIRGRFEPAEGAAEKDDMVLADVTLTVDGNEVKREENVQLGVRPSRLDGVALNDLGDVLAGAAVGETRSTSAEIPDDYERADLRGKTGEFRFEIREVKRLAPVPIETLVEQLGAENEDQLRQFIREDMESEKEETINRAKREQIHDYLLTNTSLDLPEKLSARQTDRAVLRQVIDLRQRGTPESEIEARIDELRTSAAENVQRDLKLAFILEKVAEALDVHVTDEEINTQIALMARRYNRRFDRVRDELQSQGLLAQLGDQIRHDKCISQMLADAQIVEVTDDAKE